MCFVLIIMVYKEARSYIMVLFNMITTTVSRYSRRIVSETTVKMLQRSSRLELQVFNL